MSSNSLQLGTHLRQRRKVEVAGNVKPRALLNKLLYKPARQHPFYRLTDTGVSGLKLLNSLAKLHRDHRLHFSSRASFLILFQACDSRF